MRSRRLSPLVMLASVVAVLSLSVSSVVGQTNGKTAGSLETPWGDPDLQGTWSTASATPLERPAEFAGKEFLSEEEVATLEQQAEVRATVDQPPPEGNPGTYNKFWMELGTKLQPSRRTSIIVDPPDGRLPQLKPAAQTTDDARIDSLLCSRGVKLEGCVYDSHDDLDLNDRCIVQGSSAPPLLPGPYNNNHQILQVPGYVVILTEMIHDTRVIPLDGRPALPVKMRQWNGDSRGHWEGDTLVVVTANFRKEGTGLGQGADRIRVRADFGGDPAQAPRVTERFTRVDADTLKYQFKIEDPARVRAYSGEHSINRTDDKLYEYACHEGNYAAEGMLKGPRVEEAAGGK